MRQRFRAKEVDQARRTGDDILHVRVLAIQDAQGIGVQTTASILVKLVGMLLKIGNQFGAMHRPLGRLSEGVELQSDIVKAKVIPKAGAHDDQFGIDIGTGKAEGLDADLIELTVASFLRPLMTEHLPHVIQALRMLCRQLVLDDRAHATRCSFGTQGQCLAVETVGKGVHFLLDDVSDFADGALEKRRRFNNGQTDRAIAVGFEPGPHGFFK